MVGRQFKSPRKNLKATLLSYPELSQNQQVLDLCKEYDMCRLIFAGDMNDAVKFGVLEHMMRISTSAEEAESYYQYMSADLAFKLADIVARKDDLNQLAIREMEDIVGLEDVRECKEIPTLQVIQRLKSGKVTRTQVEPDAEGNWPVVHLLEAGQFLCLLYPTMISFLDGYEPYTGEPKDPLIPASLLQSILPSLYFAQTRRTFSTQTKPAKVKKLSVPKKTVPVPTVVKPLELHRGNTIPAEAPPVEVSVQPKAPEGITRSPSITLVPAPVRTPQFSLFGNITEESPIKEEVVEPMEDAVQPVPEEYRPVIEVFQPVKEVRPMTQSSVVRTPSVVIKKQPQVQPQPEVRTTTRKIVIHKGKQERVSSRTMKPAENEVESTETSMENWEWVNFDRQAAAKHRARENCGEDCGLF